MPNPVIRIARQCGSTVNVGFVAIAILALVLCPAHTLADEPEDQPIDIRAGVTPPQLTYKFEPKYNPSARDAGVQRDVLLRLIVGKDGVPRDVELVSPLSFGLDEEAIACISQWRFKPAMKDGHAVSVFAEVWISFRLNNDFDEKAEQARSRFNGIVSRLQNQPGGKPTESQIAALQDLAKHKLPAAQYVVGTWEVKGDFMPKDVDAGLKNINMAAHKKYGPALFFIGRLKFEGTLLPKDPGSGLSAMHEAAELGSEKAQSTLGDMYETGAGG